MDEGGEDDEKERQQRHETSGPFGHAQRSRRLLLWAFIPRVQPRICRGLRNARSSDGAHAVRNPSCHSVDIERYPKERDSGQATNWSLLVCAAVALARRRTTLGLRALRAAHQPARTRARGLAAALRHHAGYNSGVIAID